MLVVYGKELSDTSTKQPGKVNFISLYVFFWVFPRRPIVVCRRFGTLYQFHLQGLDVKYEVLHTLHPALEDGTDRGFGTLYQFHLQELEVKYEVLHTLHPALEDGTDRGF